MCFEAHLREIGDAPLAGDRTSVKSPAVEGGGGGRGGDDGGWTGDGHWPFAEQRLQRGGQAWS